MRDVIEQLDSYQDHLDSVYPAVTASEVFDAGTDELETPVAPPKRAWRPVVAFCAAFGAVVAVGVSLYLVGGADTPLTDTTPRVATTAVTLPVVPLSSDDLAEWRWEQVAVGEPWADSVLDVAVFDGGFLALTDTDQAVYWSPGGMEWINADPFREVSAYQERTDDSRLPRQVITGVGNQAVIVGDTSAGHFGVWLGNPQIGEWSFLPLETNGISGNVRPLAVASNETEALVVGIEWTDAALPDDEPEAPADLPFIAQYLTWTIDPAAGTTERHALHLGEGAWADSVEGTADWFKGHWYVAIVGNSWIGGDDGWLMNDPFLTSPDGKTWTEIPRAIEPDAEGNPTGSLVSLTAGESTIIMTACNFGGDTFYVSTDGAEWTVATTEFLGHRSVYSEGIGFLTVYNAVTHSPGGQNWTPIHNSDRGPSLGTGGGVFSQLNLAASNTAVLVASDVEPGLWIYTKP